MKKVTTHSSRETKKFGQILAQQILPQQIKKGALVIGLQGDLGAGKTTFLQGFTKGLGIKEKILSPTFVVMKRFKMHRLQFDNFYHIDCYRLDDGQDLEILGFKEVIQNPKNIVAIEWPEKIKTLLPKKMLHIQLKHLEENKRELTFHT